MTVHLYEVTTGERRVLVREYTGEPPKNPMQDRNEYVETLAWNGITFDAKGGGRPTGPWVIQLDDAVPAQARKLEMLRERMAMTDDDGRPLMPFIRPFTPQVTMSTDELEARVDERAAALADRLAKQRLADLIGEEEAEQAFERAPLPKTKECPACKKMLSPQGFHGHIRLMWEKWQSQEHYGLYVEMELERQEKAAETATA